eukprot:Em0003g768a
MSTESDETTVATDVAEAGGSSEMSRLESQMSQMFEARAACATSDFRLPLREEIKGARGRRSKRAGLNEHTEPQVPVSAVGQGIRRPGPLPQEWARSVSPMRGVWPLRGNFSCNELGFVQAILGIARFTIITSIILYCLAKLAESPLIEHTIPSNSTSNQSGPIINATCSSPQASPHHFVLDFSVFMAAIFGITLFCYMTLGIVVSLWFRGDINETASLNWLIVKISSPFKLFDWLREVMKDIVVAFQCLISWVSCTTLVPLTKPGHHVALHALSYIIILFPTLDVISAYSLVTCSMVNNLYQVIMGRDTSQRKHSYDGLILVAMRAVVAILPIVCSLFISNLVYILKYGGLVGFLTAFFFPLALQLASQYKCVKVFGKELAPAAAARGTPLQPHVDTEMEVLKKDGEEEGAEFTEGNEDELGRGKVGKKGRSPPLVAKENRCT